MPKKQISTVLNKKREIKVRLGQAAFRTKSSNPNKHALASEKGNLSQKIYPSHSTTEVPWGPGFLLDETSEAAQLFLQPTSESSYLLGY